MVSLVAKVPSSGDAEGSAPHSDDNRVPAKEKDPQPPGTPKKARKNSFVRPSQDAELKDYVGFRGARPFRALLTLYSNSGTAWGRGPLAPFFGP